MFGFLAPQYRLPAWRRSYARICQHQRRIFGMTALPFLSYEATFLYQLAIDFELIHGPSPGAPQCCRLRRIAEPESELELRAATFASAFGMLLVGVKLDDDVLDSGRWYNRLIRWKYLRQIRLAHNLLDDIAPNVRVRVADAVDEHTQLETRKTHQLADYCQPTGDGFSAAFEEFARVLHADDSMTTRFASIGHFLGRAIIAWDCAVDFDADRVRGHFNPLHDAEDVRRSLSHCSLQLAQTGWQLPESGPAIQVVANVAARVYAGRQSLPQHPLGVMERWGLVRQRGHAYARCDGCEALCGAGECCECTTCAGEAGVGCCECGGGTGCVPDFLCYRNNCHCPSGPVASASSDKAGQQNSERQSPLSQWEWCHGKEAIAGEDLQPARQVVVDGQQVPARSMTNSTIPKGSRCCVVRTDPFGVHVEPA